MAFKYEEILQELGITKTPRDDGEIHIRCPLHDDSSPSFDINAENGFWWCRATGSGCGTGNIIQLVSRLENLTYKEAFEWIRSRIGGGELTINDIEEELDKIRKLMSREIETKEDEYVYPEWMLYDHAVNDVWPPWWPSRGFDVKDWMKWQVRFDTNNGDAIIPVVDMVGVTRGIIRRKPNGVLPKYWYPREFQKSRYLFGEDQCLGASHVYIVEGPLDCIWMHHMGFPAVAIMGSLLSDKQYWRLSKLGAREVTMVLDNDSSGISGMMQAIKTGKASGFSFVILPEGKDPNDIRDKQELTNILNKKISTLEMLIANQ